MKGNKYVDVKNWDWTHKFYQDPKNIYRKIRDCLKQAETYQEFADEVIFVFKDSVPDVIREALEAEGVIVEVWP